MGRLCCAGVQEPGARAAETTSEPRQLDVRVHGGAAASATAGDAGAAFFNTKLNSTLKPKPYTPTQTSFASISDLMQALRITDS